MAHTCDRCGAEFEYLRNDKPKELPAPNQISADYIFPNRSYMYIKKYNFCPKCMEKVIAFLEQKD